MSTYPRQKSVVQSPWENGHSTNPHNFTSFCATDSYSAISTTVQQRILSWASWINSAFLHLIYLYRFRVFFTQLQDPSKSNIQLHLWHAYFITPVDDDLPAGCCRMYLGAFCVPSQYYVTYVHSFYLFFQFSNDFLLQVYAVVCHRRTWTRNKDLSFADLTLCWCQHFNFQLMHTTLKIVELLKYFKIRKTAPTCFGLQGNHHQAAIVITQLILHTWFKLDT